MKKQIFIKENYLNIPIQPNAPQQLIAICQKQEDGEKRKIYEFKVPVGEEKEGIYPEKYYAQVPVADLKGMEVEVSGEFSEAFAKKIVTTEEVQNPALKERRPAIHFTADYGWTNDPNGLIYDKGIYHLYYQYNPFNTEWENMSWGHAISKDLLHWEQKDAVMFPDEDGTIFSGCAIKNERGLLGLPKDAILFFYTAAGNSSSWSKEKPFTQKIAYSLDGGMTLIKLPEPCVPEIAKDSRDPKVYWHEESQAYIMALWIEGNDFAILRSEDLMNWEISHQFPLENGWECPDIFELKTEEGESCWFFWTADGFYYIGEFDGYHFKTDGKKHLAYMSKLPYAAQSYSGVDGRVISVPWLRLKNDGRVYTSSYGVPVELSCKKTENGWEIVQKPVKELMEQARNIADEVVESGGMLYNKKEENETGAFILRVQLKENAESVLSCGVNGSEIHYVPETGELVVGEETYYTTKNQKELMLIIDDQILEVFFMGEGQSGAFALPERNPSFFLNTKTLDSVNVYKIEKM